MKKLSISLVTASILASTAFSSEAPAPKPKEEISPWITSMKIGGQFKFWYQTMDHGGAPSEEGFFTYHKGGNEWGNIEALIHMHGKANDHLKYKMSLMTVSDIGMQGNLVAAETTRPREVGASNGTASQPFWIHEAYLDYVFTKNTDVKFGRMELDTPLAFTEKWNATANSFEAIVAVNTDIPDTTLVGAWVAKGNGATSTLLHAPQVFGSESTFNSYMAFDEVGNAGGALVFGLINKSVESVPVQLWAYNINDVATAFWAQADAGINIGGNKAGVHLYGASVGVQGKTDDLIKSEAVGSDTQATTGFAIKAGMHIGNVLVYGAASSIGEGNLPLANTATHFKKTKLPTASIFSDGMVAAQPDTTAWKVGAKAKFDGIGSVSASFAGYNVGQNEGYLNPNMKDGGPASMGVIAQQILKDDIELTELDLVFATKVKDVDLKMMYINVSKTYVPGGDYGKESDQIIRAVATLKF